MMRDVNKIKAFTLAEVIAVLVVLAIIALVSMKITTHKLEHAITFSYYSTFETLKSVSGNIISDIASVHNPVGEEETKIVLPSNWSGDNMLCEKFADLLNTSKVSCTTLTSARDFSENKASIILANGSRYFVMKNTPEAIPQLNEAGVDVSEYTGYTIYADVNGSRDKSVLYEDVFPFYVTLSGKVIPAYSSTLTAGANSKDNLSAGVRYDIFTANPATVDTIARKSEWLKLNTQKEMSFKEAACKSGFVAAPVYCVGVAKAAECTFEADCTVVVNKPFRF